jgi:hypothetical protein
MVTHGFVAKVELFQSEPRCRDCRSKEVFAALVAFWLRHTADRSNEKFLWPIWSTLDDTKFTARIRRRGIELYGDLAGE